MTTMALRRVVIAACLLGCLGGGLQCQSKPRGDLAPQLAAATLACDAHDMPAVRAALDLALPQLAYWSGPLDESAVAQFWLLIEFARASGHMVAERRLLEGLVAGCSMRVATDAELLRARGRLAMTLVEAGELREALSRLQEIEALEATTLGEGDARLHLTRARLARVLRGTGEMAAAVAMATAAVSQLEQLGQEGAVELQVARHVLAMLQGASGDVVGAAQLLQVAQKALEAAVPRFDRELMSVRADLAGTWCMLRDPRGADLQHEVLQVYQRDLPNDHPVLQLVRINVARELVDADPPAALALAEAALAVLSRQDERSQRVRAARMTTATCRRLCGDAVGALELDDLVVGALADRGPRDPELLMAQINRALSLSATGDLHAARELQDALVAELSRAPTSPFLTDALAGLAQTLSLLGEWGQALARNQQVLHARQRLLAPGDPLLLRAMEDVAWAQTRTGDPLSGLRSLEHLLDTFATRDDHDSALFLEVEERLAGTLSVFGDFGGALLHHRHVLQVRERRLPRGAPQLLSARANVAAALASLEDYAGAIELQRDILAQREASLLDGDPAVQTACINLAYTLRLSGDYAAAESLQRRVLNAASARLPEGHADLALAQARLGTTLRLAGDTKAAAKLLRQAATALSTSVAADRPEMILCLSEATRAYVALGEFAVAANFARDCGRRLREQLSRCTLSPREVALLCRSNEGAVDAFGLLLMAAPPAMAAELAGEWLLLVESMRGTEQRVAGTARRAKATGRDAEVQELAREWQAATCRLASLAQQAVARDPADEVELREATLVRDRCQRRLNELGHALRGHHLQQVSVADLAATLPNGVVAVSLRSHAGDSDTDGPQVRAVVLHRDGTLSTLSLGPMATFEAGAQQLAEQGLFAASRTSLRDAVLTPILACLPEGTTRVLLAADGALQFVPWDALELSDGRLLGETLQVSRLDSLLELLDPAAPAGDGGLRLVAVGDVDYGVARASTATSRGGGEAPAPRQLSAPRQLPTFAPLVHTKSELAAIASMFAEARAGARVLQLTGADATAKALIDAVPGVGYVHLATHGWFVPEQVDGRRLRRADELLGWQLESQASLSALAPMTLSGLALAGANRLGTEALRHDATITAEQLLAVDLSHCELVVLSVCEGAVGFQDRGLGLASLRAGLRGAGARCVVASLWPVHDAATKLLMVDFYKDLLAQPPAQRDVARSLWGARLAASKREVPFRDWAGWFACGR